MAGCSADCRRPQPRPSRPTPGIEELCQKREELCRQIQQEEDEKQRLQNEVRQLTEKLARVNENLARKIASRNEFDRTIAETEAAYLKVRLEAGTGAGFWPGAPSGRSDRTVVWPCPPGSDGTAVTGAWCVPEPVLCTVRSTAWLVQTVSSRAALTWLCRVPGRGFGLDPRDSGPCQPCPPVPSGASSRLPQPRCPDGPALAWHARGAGLWRIPTGATVTPFYVSSQILESSQTLLSVLKREAGNLTKATASEQKSSGGKDS